MVFSMTEQDIPDILEMEKRYFGGMAWGARDFETAIAIQYDVPLVIRDGNGVAAYAVLRMLGPEAEVENICVGSAYRRRGLGKQLMAEMLSIAAAKQVEKLFLEVRMHNLAARRLYEAHGFRELYVRKAYYRDPVEDGIVMVKER